ncbi:MAG: hypothetical protein QNI99_07055 [Woeseiaceae bacterium]|nr:hypothetical protein [Woeseiaceae bacterium]
MAEEKRLSNSKDIRSPVTAVYDWYDGIREGPSQIGDMSYRFESRRLDCKEYRGDYESVDLFDLTAVGGDDTLLATARFEGPVNLDETEIQKNLFAYWSIIERSDG